jgi:RNA polymerase sigma factor (sigma-70 family)
MTGTRVSQLNRESGVSILGDYRRATWVVPLFDKISCRTKQTGPRICYIGVETIVANERAFSVQVDDTALVRRLNRGDAAALAVVYESYRDDLLRLAVSLLGERMAAEDIVQDVFVRFAGLARTFRLTGSLKGYLATCVANASRNVLKASRRRPAGGSEEPAGRARVPKRGESRLVGLPIAENRDWGPGFPTDGDGPDRWLICSEQFTLVRRALGELPAEQREVVSMHLYGELPFREIAAWQQTSIKTVQSRYQYGLNKLRALLDGEVVP